MVDAENADTVLALINDNPEVRAILLDYTSKNITIEARNAAVEKKIDQQIEKQIKRNKTIERAFALFAAKKPADIKKEWATAETTDGLRIEKYKGNDVQIVIPSILGKTSVIEIGPDALRAAAGNSGSKNAYQKKMFKNKCVVLQDGIKRIGERAFLGCVYLTDAVIPASVEEIATDSFGDCHKVTIHAPSGSYAEQYAIEHNIPFVAE